jgi:hypothetical protein
MRCAVSVVCRARSAPPSLARATHSAHASRVGAAVESTAQRLASASRSRSSMTTSAPVMAADMAAGGGQCRVGRAR